MWDYKVKIPYVEKEINYLTYNILSDILTFDELFSTKEKAQIFADSKTVISIAKKFKINKNKYKL